MEKMAQYIQVDKIMSKLGESDEDMHCKGVILSTQTVDAVEVVRCGECKNGETCEFRQRVWCQKMGRYMSVDGFCSYGMEAKDENP